MQLVHVAEMLEPTYVPAGQFDVAVLEHELDPEEVVQENITKLEARYTGSVSVERSENRKAGDL